MAKNAGKKNGGGLGRNGRPKGLKLFPKKSAGKSGSTKGTGKTQAAPKRTRRASGKT